MFRRICSAAILALITLPLASLAQVYKSVDKDGNVIFSDQASPGSESVDVPSTNTLPSVTPTKPKRKKATAGAVYDYVGITSPANDEAVVAPGGNFSVSVVTEPGLRSGHTVILLLDGAPTSVGGSGSFNLETVPRGTHTLEARVQDAQCDFVASSGTSTVHVVWPGTGRSGVR